VRRVTILAVLAGAAVGADAIGYPGFGPDTNLLDLADRFVQSNNHTFCCLIGFP
jgi:hypothetical protein